MHSGKFQWNVLPFGISIAVQTFSFVINKAIGHCSDFAANYLVDIIVFSRMAEDHLDHLEKVFTAPQQAELKIKASKCEFFKSHVCYSGFLIGESGIRCKKSKVEAINKITGFPLFRNHKIPGFFQDFSRNLTPFSRYIFALAANLQLQFLKKFAQCHFSCIK